MNKSVMVGLWTTVLAGAALAQLQALLNIRVSLDGANWFNTLEGGQRVHVGVFMSVEGAYGVAGAEYNIVASGFRDVDTVDISSPRLGRQAPWALGSSTQQVYRTGNQIRIDAANDDADSADRGIVSLQRDPASGGTAYTTANPGLVYMFDVVFGPIVSGVPIHIQIQSSLQQIRGGVMNYHSGNSVTRSTATANVSTQGSQIFRNLPTPGVASAFGVFGVMVAARRRRAM